MACCRHLHSAAEVAGLFKSREVAAQSAYNGPLELGPGVHVMVREGVRAGARASMQAGCAALPVAYSELAVAMWNHAMPHHTM